MTESILSRHVKPLNNIQVFLHDLLPKMNISSLLMLGEATHGTKEFYEIRSEITKGVIKGLNRQTSWFIALESDWPETSEINDYINGRGDYKNGEEVLRKFQRWPTW